ncbi:TPA: helix-turn-helix transcriptional regulator [Clostridioides difficile]|uniref:helix-turn-helix domain-containing protein n=1 Tax=Clostridioides difficile TaxID=1496 RepID=UPI001C19A3A3|nr:helix-turn-helix transcriptional regulator [Clostridioides difficile]MDV9710599.1 helix-turn-helix transcriptional regulator [Clostridioides difficile]UUC40694.1 helix-turn-helix transcriptional regulator [Clostridioides difficile]HBF5147615.1 helix-turn-helix transcriptional regulator [Clostridioides difficile]HBF6468918.1 helix-turn-helix transcriptional regulator [Clostridioides difficile]HBH3651466.1 helix-turn-helix transcriptional regulator [Clostridioides difficile]
MLKELRKKRRLTQKDLSEKANLSRTYISELERGLYKNINIDVIIDLSLALEVNALILCKYFIEENLKRRKI